MLVSKERRARPCRTDRTVTASLLAAFTLAAVTLFPTTSTAVPIKGFQNLDYSTQAASFNHAVTNGQQEAGIILVATTASKYKQYADYFLKMAKQAKAKGKTSEYKKFMSKYKSALAKYKKYGGASNSGGSTASSSKVASNSQADKYAQYAAYFLKMANQAKAKGKTAEYKEYMEKHKSALAKVKQYGGTTSSYDTSGRAVAGSKTVNVSSQSAFNNAIASAGNGTTIVVQNGTYTASLSNPLRGNNVTLKAANRHKAKIRGILAVKGLSTGVVDGFLFEASGKQHDALYMDKSSNIKLTNNKVIHRNSDYGFRIHRSKGITIANNHFEGHFNHAVSGKELIENMQVTNNTFVDCGLGCIDAGQTPDGTLATEQTSTRIEIANNRFEGRKVSGGKSFRGIGIKIKNVVETVVKNNKFTGSWNYPIQTSFGSVGSGNKSKLGHYGSKHPKKILMQGNDFGKGGNLDLAGRGRGSSDTFEVRSNKGSVSCTVGTMQTHGSSINNQINWGTVNRSKPRLNQSGNSFKCN